MNKTMLLLLAVALCAVLSGAASLAQSAKPMPIKDFVKAAAQSDQFEIDEGQLAVAQSQSAQVRAFAQQMIHDHALMAQAMAQAAERSGLPPPPKGLSGDQAMLLSGLQSQRGSEFDKAYAKQQVLAHVQALTVQQGYVAGGADRNVRGAAASAVPIIQRHLDMARQLQAALGS